METPEQAMLWRRSRIRYIACSVDIRLFQPARTDIGSVLEDES